MSQISQKSITGITSITTPAGIDDVFTVHSGDTTERFRVDQSGNQNISGIVTATNFKTGSSNLHSTGLTVGDTFVHSTGVNGSSADIDDFVSVGNNIHLGNAGVITATSFVGDGSDLTNLPAGLGTALSATATSPLNKMYYTNQVLGVPSSVTVDVPASASKAYTQYADIKVDGSADLIVAEGDDLIPDILGLADFGTFGGGASAGRIRVNSISNAANDGSPTVQKGLVVTGVCTATSFSGSGANLTSLPAQATIANNADNRVITGGSGVNLNGESTLTYGGTELLISNASPSVKLNDTDNSGVVDINNVGGVAVIQSTGDTLFETNSTERLRIGSNGFVNIGTGTAQQQLTVQNSAQHSLVRVISSPTAESGIDFGDTDDGDQGKVRYNNVNSYMKFEVATAEKLRITSSGVTVTGIITATNLELAIPTSRRNFFINGGMYVAARGTTTGLNAGGYGGPDHIKLVNNLGTFTVSQGNENESPRSEGFTYCYKLNCTSASGPSNSNYVYLNHVFSGYDLQLLRYGYTNPHPITISFWAKSNKTGNFTVTFRTVAGVDRLISKVHTIPDSNWNFYSATFVGDTSAVNVTAGMAYLLEIWLDGGNNYTGGTVQTTWSGRSNADRGAGSTLNIASSTSNYFYYTGLQVELGTVATPFEHQLYQWYEHECYRFFYHPNRTSDLLELHGMGHRVADTMGAVVQAYPWPRQMRASPTVSFDDNNGNSNRFAVNGSNNSTTFNVSLSLQQNDQGIMGAFQYPHGITNISENESFRLWAYNFKAEAEF